MSKSLEMLKSAGNALRLAVLSVFVIAAAAACGGQTVDLKQAVETSVTLNDATMPADIKLASAAILMKMKGFDDQRVNGVTFLQGSSDTLKAIGMDYDGFQLKGVSILNYEPTAQGTELAGIFVFEDVIGRRNGVRYLAKYKAQDQGIAIEHASVVQVYTTQPRVEAYLVPYDPNVDQVAISVDHNTLYSYAVNNAITPDQAGEGTADYDMFLFVMDRSSPTSDVKGRISKNTSSRSGFEDATTVLDYNGWKVAVISGEADPKSEDTLYAKLVHFPGEEAPWFARAARLRGLFGMTVNSKEKL